LFGEKKPGIRFREVKITKKKNKSEENNIPKRIIDFDFSNFKFVSSVTCSHTCHPHQSILVTTRQIIFDSHTIPDARTFSGQQ
jgi:hypothetical protein